MRALPTTFFVDRSGVVRRVAIGGPLARASLLVTLEDLLAGSR
ncbi:MAG: hypothetical protein AB1449_04450 [Chloroflexota bacterium]